MVLLLFARHADRLLPPARRRLQTAILNMDLSEFLAELQRPETMLNQMEKGFKQPLAKQEMPAIELLTPRETQVLRLIAEGYSTKVVAHKLGMSSKTASCHRYRIMDKLGIHDVVTLTHYAVRKGIAAL
jgi:DNA-binding NarL/FixJ family response regulator